jgi:hypothetical protein
VVYAPLKKDLTADQKKQIEANLRTILEAALTDKAHRVKLTADDEKRIVAAAFEARIAALVAPLPPQPAKSALDEFTTKELQDRVKKYLADHADALAPVDGLADLDDLKTAAGLSYLAAAAPHIT